MSSIAAFELPTLAKGATDRLLYDELAHRMSNELASAACSLRLNRRLVSEESTRSVLDSAIARLQAFSDLQRILARPFWTGPVDLGSDLIELVALMTATRSVVAEMPVKVAADPVFLDAQQGWLLKLAVAELITNAYKHTLRSSQGILSVELHQAGSTGELIVACATLSPPTGGLQAKASRGGQGSQIVEDLVAVLGGYLEVCLSHGACITRITFPV